MSFQRLKIKNSDGHLLSARLDLPLEGEPYAYAIFAHCFTCSKNLKAVANISKALTAEGIGVLRFDFTGLGQSEGDFADTNFSSNVADLVKTAVFLAINYEAPQILIGHSLGGAAVLQAADQIPSVKAVVTIGAPYNPGHVTHLLQNSLDEIEECGLAEVKLAGRIFTIKKQFLDDLAERNMKETIHNLKRALLVMHAPLDNTVGVDNAASIFVAAKHPKSFVSLDDADHLMSREEDSRYAGKVIAGWVTRYVAKPAPDETKAPSAANNKVVVRTGKGFRTDVRSRDGHSLIIDEPISVGGTNLGPNPYDYLMASLGGCTSITLRMYANRKEWPVDAIEVHLSHDKIHARDCEDCESEKGKVDVINREIRLEGELSEEQRQRLLEIADKCPVHRTLHGEIKVRSVLVDAD